MKPQFSSPHSQQPSTCPCPKPDQFTPRSHLIFLKIRFNIILRPTHRSFKWSLSLRFPHQNHAYTSPLPRTCYMPLPSHSSRFDRLKYPNLEISLNVGPDKSGSSSCSDLCVYVGVDGVTGTASRRWCKKRLAKTHCSWIFEAIQRGVCIQRATQS